MTTVYFHGTPGSPRELALFPSIDCADWLAPDRAALAHQVSQQERFDVLANMVQSACERGPVRLIGFSLGAYVALETARRLPEAPLALHLVSAAAPLELGDFLDDMAGKAVFAAAMKGPERLALLARMQAGAARALPGLFVRALFASAQGDDRVLGKDPHFRCGMTAILRDCLMGGTANYRSELAAYVQLWADGLADIRHPVTIWHGTRDNWAPPAMADALERALPNVIARHRLEGRSHYSALGEALGHLAQECAARA